MLVVSRKVQEEIRIGNDIIIKVIKTGPNRVQIGVEAPDSVRVLRNELFLEERGGRSDSVVAVTDERASERIGQVVSQVVSQPVSATVSVDAHPAQGAPSAPPLASMIRKAR